MKKNNSNWVIVVLLIILVCAMLVAMMTYPVSGDNPPVCTYEGEPNCSTPTLIDPGDFGYTNTPTEPVCVAPDLFPCGTATPTLAPYPAPMAHPTKGPCGHKVCKMEFHVYLPVVGK